MSLMSTERLVLRRKTGRRGKILFASCLSLIGFLACPHGASAFETQSVHAALPVSTEAHGESDGTDAVPPLQDTTTIVKIALNFFASSSGNVELLLGIRDPESGGLDFADAAVSVGFDSGSWVVRHEGLRQEAAQGAAEAGMSPRSLVIRAKFFTDETPPELLSFTVDGEDFTALPDGDVLDLFSPHRFNAFRVFQRGDAHSTSASVTLFTSPTLIIIR